MPQAHSNYVSPRTEIDLDRLWAFERAFDGTPVSMAAVRVLGNGRFTSVFTIDGLDAFALKRLPPFGDATVCMHFQRALDAYGRILQDPIGLHIPPQESRVVPSGDGSEALYVIQDRLPSHSFALRRWHESEDGVAVAVLRAVLVETLRVWHRNEIEKELEIRDSLTGFDARLSNWSIDLAGDAVLAATYVDTSTPFLRRMGQDRLDAAYYLRCLPGWYAGLKQPLFREDVLNRCYDFRHSLIDLLAELHADSTPERFSMALEAVNTFLAEDAADLYVDPVTHHEVTRFATRERRFWRRLNRTARLKRFISARLFRMGYPYLLPNGS